MRQGNRVVVTGMGTANPLGLDPEGCTGTSRSSCKASCADQRRGWTISPPRNKDAWKFRIRQTQARD